MSPPGPPSITVVGSAGHDITVTCRRLPVRGETVLAHGRVEGQGNKGANQAVGMARQGAAVRFVGALGDDAHGQAMLDRLAAEGVDTGFVAVTGEAPTSLALILVEDGGENQIVVEPGANLTLTDLPEGALAGADAVVCQLEIPLGTVAAAAAATDAFFVLNPSPVQELPATLVQRCDLLVVNDVEQEALGDLLGARCVAVTHGAAGASLLRDGAEVATATPPTVEALDTVGAGDAFCAALVVALLRGDDDAAALRWACAAGAAAVTRPGAMDSAPTAEQVAALLR